MKKMLFVLALFMGVTCANAQQQAETKRKERPRKEGSGVQIRVPLHTGVVDHSSPGLWLGGREKATRAG